MKLLCVADYYESKGASGLCHAFKAGDAMAIHLIAKYMSYYWAILPLDSILLPIPSHTGQATATLALAEQLSKFSGLPFADLIKGQPRKSLYTLKAQNQSTPPKFFGFHNSTLIDNKTPVLIDAVFDTGQTTLAAAELFPEHSPVIFTFARVGGQSAVKKEKAPGSSLPIS